MGFVLMDVQDMGSDEGVEDEEYPVEDQEGQHVKACGGETSKCNAYFGVIDERSD